LYWYNHLNRRDEKRVEPRTDKEALALLGDHPNSCALAGEYERRRSLGSTIEWSLVRTGEVARMEHLRHQPSR
jgi:hypothetical protein